MINKYQNIFVGTTNLLYIISPRYGFFNSFFSKYLYSPIKKKPTCFLYFLEHSTTFLATYTSDKLYFLASLIIYALYLVLVL